MMSNFYPFPPSLGYKELLFWCQISFSVCLISATEKYPLAKHKFLSISSILRLSLKPRDFNHGSSVCRHLVLSFLSRRETEGCVRMLTMRFEGEFIYLRSIRKALKDSRALKIWRKNFLRNSFFFSLLRENM